MELSLTAVASRKSRKAILRVLGGLDKLQEAFKLLPLSETKVYCLMVTLVCEPPDFFEVVPNTDGIHQVKIGYEESFSYLPADDQVLLRAVFGSISRGVLSYPRFTDADRHLIQSFLLGWQRGLGLSA